jgi:hypothetical protein
MFECALHQQDKEYIQKSATMALKCLFSLEPQLREKARALGLRAQLDQMVHDDPSLAVYVEEVIAAMTKEGEDAEEDDDEDPGSELYAAYEDVGDDEWMFDVEGEAVLAKYILAADEAAVAKHEIDKGLKSNRRHLSVSPGGMASGRRPITTGES